MGIHDHSPLELFFLTLQELLKEKIKNERTVTGVLKQN
jgi:hypothetical protein